MIVFILSNLILNCLTIINAKKEPANDFCLNHTFGYTHNLDIENFVNNYPTVERGGEIYFQLDISSDLQTLNCIGRKIENVKQNNNYSGFLTSFKFFNLYFFFTNFLVFLFFYILEKIFYKTFIISLISNSIIVNILFFAKLKFDYQAASVILFFLLYNYLKKPNLNKESKNNTIFLFFNVYLLLFNYDLFSKFLFFFLILFLFVNKNYIFNSRQINLIKFASVSYYLLRLISGINRELIQIWETLSNGMYSGGDYFADIYYAFSVLNCRNNDCGTIQNNYGPVFEYFDYFNDLNLSANMFSIITIFVLIYAILKAFHNISYNHYILFLMIVSPPLTFVVERMNLDLFVALIALASLSLYENNSKILGLVLLSALSQIKIYPIFLIFGILLYQIISENKSHLKSSIIFFILNFITLASYYFQGNISNNVPKPTGVSWTFGIMSHFINYKDFFDSNSNLIPLFIIIFINLFLIYILKKFFQNVLLYNQIIKSNLIFTFLFTFLLLSLFYNFDYRAIVLIIPTYFLINKKKLETFELLIVIFLLTSVSPYLPELNYSVTGTINFLLPLFYIIINHLTFYAILISIANSTFKEFLAVKLRKNKSKL